MYAVVEIKGMQYKVQPESLVQIPKTDIEAGEKVSYDRVLYINNGKKQLIGTPVVKGAKVEATIVDHGKEKKVVVFKKKRRKRYKRTRGHRQQYTTIQIDKIVTNGKKKSAASSKKKEETKKADAESSKE